MNARSNFSKKELNTIIKYLVKCSNFITMRINKCGNVDLDFRFCNAEGYAHFVIYKRPAGYIIRRRVYDDSPFGTGTYLNNNKPMSNLNDMMIYFTKYITKRKNSFFAIA